MKDSFFAAEKYGITADAAFIVSCSLFFSVFHVFDMTALAMLAFLAIMIGAIFSRNVSHYWKAVISEGIGSEMAVTIATILLIIGMYAK